LATGVAYAARSSRPAIDRRSYLERTEKELDSFEEKFDVLRSNSPEGAPSENYMEMDDLELLAKDIRGDLVTLASSPKRGWARRSREIDRKLESLHTRLARIESAPGKLAVNE
jgi:hypothetical protein